MTHTNAEEMVRDLQEQEIVYNANVLSDNAILFVEDIEQAWDARTFKPIADRGWRIAATIDAFATMYIAVPKDQ